MRKGMINDMKQIRTPREWFNEHVDAGQLYDSILKSLGEAVREDSKDMDEENYIGLVQDIVSSGAGQYTPYYALEYFDYDIDIENINYDEYERVIDELDSFTWELENIINDEVASKLGATVQFGYWESDGTFCLMSFYNVDEYKKNKEEVEAYLNGEKEFDGLE